MGNEYLDRSKQNESTQHPDTPQKKVDPIAQLKWLDNSIKAPTWDVRKIKPQQRTDAEEQELLMKRQQTNWWNARNVELMQKGSQENQVQAKRSNSAVQNSQLENPQVSIDDTNSNRDDLKTMQEKASMNGSEMEVMQTGGVKTNCVEALELLKLGLSSQEAAFVTLSGDGYIDLEMLLKGESQISVGENYKALIGISKNPKTVELIVADSEEGIDGNGKVLKGADIPFQFKDPVNDARDMWKVDGGNDDFTEIIMNKKKYSFSEYCSIKAYEDVYTLSGGAGKTSAPLGTMPNTEFDRRISESLDPSERVFSTNSNYQVYINKRLLKYPETIGKAVETIAHELYGHLFAMFEGKSSSHGPVRKPGDDATEWNYNAELETSILNHVKEAQENYSSRTKN